MTPHRLPGTSPPFQHLPFPPRASLAPVTNLQRLGRHQAEAVLVHLQREGGHRLHGPVGEGELHADPSRPEGTQVTAGQ